MDTKSAIFILISVLSVSEVISHGDQCLSSRKIRLAENYHPHVRFPRSVSQNEKKIENSMVYLDGGEHLLKLKESNGENAVPNGRRSSQTVFPKEEFTVSIWTKPEGGQYENAVLLGEYNLEIFLK